MERFVLSISLAAACAALAPSVALAGGLDSGPDVGAEQLGRGGAWLAVADDPIAAYFNPAAMSFQPYGVSIGSNFVIQNECFARKGPGNTPVSPGSSLPAPGDPNGPPEETCALAFSPNPHIGAVFRPTERLAIGIAVVTPHSAGQGDWPETIDYQRNGNTRQEPAPSRYLQVDHGLAVVAYPTVSLSYAITPTFSLGAGFVWGVASVDFTTYTEALSPSNADDFFGHQDVKAHLTAKDLFVPGFVVGMQWHATPRVDLAAWYRWSDKIDGTSDLELTSQTYLQGGAPNEDPCKGKEANCNVTEAPEAGSFKLAIPMEAKIGVRYHHPLSTPGETPKWKKNRPLVHDSLSEDRFDIETDLSWSHDSAVDAIEIRFGSDACRDNPKCVDSGIPVKGTPGQVPVNGDIPHEWNDVLGVRLGGDVTILPNRLALRGGAFFESKGQPDEYLNLDFHRGWKVGLSLGGTVRVGPADLSLAYGHVFFGTLDNEGKGAIHALSGDATTKYRSQQAVNGGSLGASINDVAAAANFRF
jgi:long-chain fatty acid transport protein